MPTPQDLPNFAKPPVIEVVCGIQFKELDSLLAPHLGILWEKFKTEYPRCLEVPPLAQVVERFDTGVQPQMEVEFSDKPVLPRIWFVRSKENSIIQVQRDRFLHNWKKVSPEDDYPRYETVISMFRDRLASFEDFLQGASLGKIKPIQYEMTYVNHIPQGQGWDSLREVATLFPDFSWKREKDRFLPEAENISWRTTFALPDRAGRLHATMRNVQRKEDKLPILLFELTARGMPSDTSKDAMWTWFDLAHKWIVCGFEDLTGPDVQKKVWEKTT